MTEHEQHGPHEEQERAGADPSTAADTPPTSSWRHPVNVGHLVMGLAFLGLVLVWALVAAGAVADDDIRWLLPVPWVMAGGAGLVATALAARRSADRPS